MLRSRQGEGDIKLALRRRRYQGGVAETTPAAAKVWFVVRPPDAVAQDVPIDDRDARSR